MVGGKVRFNIALGVLLLLAACEPPDATPTPATKAAPPSAAIQPAPSPSLYVGARLDDIGLDPGQGGTSQSSAVRLVYVLDDSPAAAAGFHEGDIVLAGGGTPLGSTDEFIKFVDSRAPNVPVDFSVLRNGQRLSISVTPQLRPADLDARYAAYDRQHLKSERQAAADAARTGDHRSAFAHDVNALRFAALEQDGDTYTALLADTATELPLLKPPPPIPSDADRHNRRAIAILQSGSTGQDFDRAASEFSSAVYKAPWLADPYLNEALALEKAGSTETAIAVLRNYLVLRTAARNDDAIKQKLAELEVLADERKPWLPFTGSATGDDRSMMMSLLRGRNFTITYTTAPPDSAYRVGDVLFRGTIHGHDVQGKYLMHTTDARVVKCYGAEYDLDSQGQIDSTGKKVVLSVKSISFNADTCQETGSTWAAKQTLNGR